MSWRMRAQTHTASLHNAPSTRLPAVNSKLIIYPLSQNIHANIRKHNHPAISAMCPAYITASLGVVFNIISLPSLLHLQGKKDTALFSK